MVVKKIHKRVFQNVLYENWDCRVIQYDGDITVESTSDISKNVWVEFNQNSDIDETSIQISNGHDSPSTCSFDKDKISVLEVRNGGLIYRFGKPNTASQYLVMDESQYQEAIFHDSEFGAGLPDHIKRDVHRDAVPASIENSIENEILETDVVVEFYGLSHKDTELFVRLDENQPLINVDITDPERMNVFDFRYKDLDAPSLRVNLPDGFQGSLNFSSSNIFNDGDFAVVPPRVFYDKSYVTLCLNDEHEPFTFDVKVEMNGFVPAKKTVEVTNEKDELNVSFNRDMFTGLGTIYFGATDELPNVSARGRNSKYYNVEKIENPPDNLIESFENEKFGTDPNHTLYKIDGVVPNEKIHIHYGFDSISPTEPGLSKVTVSEGETKYVFEDISYREPIVQFKNKSDTTLRVITEQDEKNLSQYGRFEINLASTDTVEYSVVDVESDGSSVLYTDTVNPSNEHRTLVTLTESSSNVILPK